MIFKRTDHNLRNFLKRTISAQIHLVTFILAIVGLVILLPYAGKHGSVHYWATLAYGITGILVFGTSTLYHFLDDGYQCSPELAHFFEKLDQITIYLFIAGTYTPFLMNTLVSPWRWILLVSVWMMAITGIFYTAFRSRLPVWAQSRSTYVFLFVAMGWTAVIRLGEIEAHLKPATLHLLFAGAAAYLIGAVIYATKKPRLFVGVFGFHELWHVLVTAGFVLHYGMVSSFYF